MSWSYCLLRQYQDDKVESFFIWRCSALSFAAWGACYCVVICESAGSASHHLPSLARGWSVRHYLRVSKNPSTRIRAFLQIEMCGHRIPGVCVYCVILHMQRIHSHYKHRIFTYFMAFLPPVWRLSEHMIEVCDLNFSYLSKSLSCWIYTGNSVRYGNKLRPGSKRPRSSARSQWHSATSHLLQQPWTCTQTHRSPDIHDNPVLLWCLHGEAGNAEWGPLC